MKGSPQIDRAAIPALLATVGTAGYLILLDYFMNLELDDKVKRYMKTPFLVMQFLVIAVATTVLCLFFEFRSKGLPHWSCKGVGSIIFMSVVATVGAFFIQTRFQPMMRPDRAALVFTLESPIAGLFAYMFLGERYSPGMLIGATMIVLAVGYGEVFASRSRSVRPQ
jgi:drug/metabolite transporter (DMT)-like permease